MQSPEEVASEIAGRVRDLRLGLGWKQETLAERAGISLATLKRLEKNGRTGFLQILRVGQALGRLDDFSLLLVPPPVRTVAELEERARGSVRKRGNR